MTEKITLREELIFLLNHASELEHSLCCSYLFTAMTLKDRPDEGLTPEQLAAVKGWKRVLNGIAIDEMMHLGIVNSLLVAVGSAPHFDRPNFPHDCAYYMPELSIGLEPFNETTMQHFIAVEQPTGADVPYPVTPQGIREFEGSKTNDIGPDPHLLESQGDVYGLVAQGVRTLCSRLGESNVFVGPAPRPAVMRFFQSSGWEPAWNLQSTIKAVVKIVEQGEGASGDNPDCHYTKFANILEEYKALKAQDPSFEPARPVLQNPFSRTPPEGHGGYNLITDDLAIDVSDLFNETYVALLNVFARMFVLTEETEDEVNALVEVAFALMVEALLPLGELLCRLPAGPETPGRTAGPSFVVKTMHALPYKNAAWHLLNERFEELGKHAGDLARIGGEDVRPIRTVEQAFKRMASMTAVTAS
jgi:hypothetical protein